MGPRLPRRVWNAITTLLVVAPGLALAQATTAAPTRSPSAPTPADTEESDDSFMVYAVMLGHVWCGVVLLGLV